MSDTKADYNSYQKGILSDLTHHASFVTFFLTEEYFQKIGKKPDIDNSLRNVVANFHKQLKRIEDENPSTDEHDLEKTGLVGIIGISSHLTKEWFEDPPEIIEYAELQGKEKYSHLPATGGDIFLHIKSNRRDLCFLAAKDTYDRIRKIHIDGNSILAKVEQTDGWSYLVGKNGMARDLTGFEDGTKNPKTEEQKLSAAVISAKVDPKHAGGSFVVAQKWIHNLDDFHSLAEHEQEQVIGRKKPDSNKLPKKPDFSHVGRVEVEGADGKELKILRHSLPFGTAAEHGLYFIGYSSDSKKFDAMLRSMTEASSINPHLDLMRYTTAVSGQYFYIPNTEELQSIGRDAHSKL